MSDVTGEDMEKAFYIGVEELKYKAISLNGDAIIHLRYDTDILSNNEGFYSQMYGTVVKLKS